MPDVVANLRVDQAWGFAGISAALHDASGAYYGTPNVVNNGHPEDKYGWALAGGAKFNLPGGDMIGFNVCYTEGAAGFCTNQGAFQLYDNSNSVGLAWIADGVFGTGTQIELTRVWSALAAYEHIWNPKWRTAWGGGYVNVDYNGAATNIINARLPGVGPANCGVVAAGADHHRLHSRRRQQLQSGLQLLGSLYPHPVEPGAAARYRSAGDVYPPQHRLQRPGGLGGERVAAGSRRTVSSTIRTSGPRCSAGSATSIHDRLSDPGKLRTPGGQPPGVLMCQRLAAMFARLLEADALQAGLERRLPQRPSAHFRLAGHTLFELASKNFKQEFEPAITPVGCWGPGPSNQ